MINTRKYQTGGAAPQQEASSREQIQQVVMQISEMTGEQPETVMAAIKNGGENFKQVIQALQSGDAQTAKQMIQQLAGAQMARQGAKLQYIKNLKGTCPEGTHLEYYKAGGRLCKKCMKNQEEEVKQEKKGGVLSQYKEKVKKDCGGAKIKAGCGAKMKKHQIGGTIETLRQSLGLEKKNEITKAQTGLKFGGSNKDNRFVSQQNVLPEVVVKGNRPYRFDRRTTDLGNGYKMTSDVMYDEYDKNGGYYGDLSGIMGGRVIYQTPFGNDTIYGGREASYLNDPQRYKLQGQDQGFMEVPMNRNNQNAHKANFYRMIKKSHVSPYSQPQERQAFQRAKRGN